MKTWNKKSAADAGPGMMTCGGKKGGLAAAAFISISLMALVFSAPEAAMADESDGVLNLPNLPAGMSAERVWGIGPSNPYPYYQRPRYRFPVYDNQGNGKLVYGYGGKETFNYTAFTPQEGHY